MDIDHSAPPQPAAVRAFLRGHNSLVVARTGELVEAAQNPALVAHERGRVVGVLTYIVSGPDCEVLTLHAEPPREGLGSALLAELEATLSQSGCSRLWLITTNDNLDALRFYQRRGFRFLDVHPGAVDEARRVLKPAIGKRGLYGIAIRDELVLEKILPAGGAALS